MKGFVEFIRKQGVVGFAVGFILGTEISRLVKSFVDNIINPFVGLGLGFAKNLDGASVRIASANIKWGSFVVTLINFIIIAAVVYFAVTILRLDRLDKPKEPSPAKAIDSKEKKK